MVFLWIAAYGLVYALASRFANPWVAPLAMTGYSAALIGWVWGTGQARYLGLCPVRRGMPGGLYGFLPLLMMPVCNLLTARAFSPALPTVTLMLAVCSAEELFFRGFLLRHLMKYGALPAVLLSGGAFALLHLANLAGSGDTSYVLAQVLFAFAAGVCFGAAAVRSGSLLPGFLAHFLTNITAGAGAAEPAPLVWLCIALYGCYGAFACIQLSEKERES